MNSDFYADKLRAFRIPIPNRRIMQLNDLRKAVSNLLANPFYQETFLLWIASTAGLSATQTVAVIERWRRERKIWIEDFAPYAHYCLRVELSFALGIVKDLPRFSRRTNRLDLEYCFYLPFCMAFTSRDKFLRDMADLLLRSDQEFIWAEDLKSDLARCTNEASRPIEKIRTSRFKDPPNNPNSVIAEICKKHEKSSRPREPVELRPQNRISAEDLAKMPTFQEFLKSKIKEIDEAETLGRPAQELEQRFMVRKRLVTREILREEFPGINPDDL